MFQPDHRGAEPAHPAPGPPGEFLDRVSAPTTQGDREPPAQYWIGDLVGTPGFEPAGNRTMRARKPAVPFQFRKSLRCAPVRGSFGPGLERARTVAIAATRSDPFGVSKASFRAAASTDRTSTRGTGLGPPPPPSSSGRRGAGSRRGRDGGLLQRRRGTASRPAIRRSRSPCALLHRKERRGLSQRKRGRRPNRNGNQLRSRKIEDLAAVAAPPNEARSLRKRFESSRPRPRPERRRPRRRPIRRKRRR